MSPPCVDDELELLGEVLEDEPMEELVPPLIELADPIDPEAAPPLVLSAVSVRSSILPEACRPCCCWNFFSAAFVFGPAMPSTGPALKPLSFRACWTCVTFELSLADDADEALDDGEVGEAEDDGEVDEEAEDDGVDVADELIAGCCWL